MSDHLSQNELESYLCSAAMLLLGPVDASDYRQCISPRLFFKRLSDGWEAAWTDKAQMPDETRKNLIERFSKQTRSLAEPELVPATTVTDDASGEDREPVRWFLVTNWFEELRTRLGEGSRPLSHRRG